MINDDVLLLTATDEEKPYGRAAFTLLLIERFYRNPASSYANLLEENRVFT